MPIHYDTIENGRNKKSLIFYSLIVCLFVCLFFKHDKSSVHGQIWFDLKILSKIHHLFLMSDQTLIHLAMYTIKLFGKLSMTSGVNLDEGHGKL